MSQADAKKTQADESPGKLASKKTTSNGVDSLIHAEAQHFLMPPSQSGLSA
jgi:hypothetical protein